MDLTGLARARLGARRAPVDDELSGLLARESLRDLGVLYAMAVDAGDTDALRQMFHPDAVLDRDGAVASGREQILATLGAAMSGFRRMIHTPETHVAHAEGVHGTGVSTAHAELVTGRGVVLAAYEYEDTYAVHEQRWVFTARRIRFVYATRADQYAETLPHADRVRLPGEPSREPRGGWFSDSSKWFGQDRWPEN